MFDKLSRSWGLVKASASVLRSDKELMLFPLISGLATLVVLASFALPTFAFGIFDNGLTAISAFWGFLFYFCQYTVIIFFNCALVGAAMIRMDGGDPTLSDGFRAASSRMGAILGYAAIAATVGMLLGALKNRENNLLVRLLGSGLGAMWTLATFLVVPILVSTDVGPIDALKSSVNLLKRTWGESIIGQAGIGLAFGLLTAVVVVAGFASAFFAAQVSTAMAIGIGGFTVAIVLVMGIYQAALSGVYSAALYQYVTRGEAPAAFQDLHLEQAFAAK